MLIAPVFIWILTNYLVIGNRKDIMVNFNRDSWIDKDNFKTTIELSFPYSRCCNIFIDGN